MPSAGREAASRPGLPASAPAGSGPRAERRRRREQAVDDLVERAVAAQTDHQRAVVAGGRGRQCGRVAAATRLGHVEVADGVADRGDEPREAAAGAAAAGGRVGDDQRPGLGAGDVDGLEHAETVPDGRRFVRYPFARPGDTLSAGEGGGRANFAQARAKPPQGLPIW